MLPALHNCISNYPDRTRQAEPGAAPRRREADRPAGRRGSAADAEGGPRAREEERRATACSGHDSGRASRRPPRERPGRPGRVAAAPRPAGREGRRARPWRRRQRQRGPRHSSPPPQRLRRSLRARGGGREGAGGLPRERAAPSRPEAGWGAARGRRASRLRRGERRGGRARDRGRRQAPPPPQTAPQYGRPAAPRGKGGAAPRPPPPASPCRPAGLAPRPERPSRGRGRPRPAPAAPPLAPPPAARGVAGGWSPSGADPQGSGASAEEGVLLPGSAGLERSPQGKEVETPEPKLRAGPPPPAASRRAWKLETPAGARKLTEGVAVAPTEDFFPEGIGAESSVVLGCSA